MIKAKEAVQIARDQMLEWFAEPELDGLELDEVDLTDDKHFWLVTWGYRAARPNPTASEVMGATAGTRPDSGRIYKIFEIDAETGEVRSMKQRKL